MIIETAALISISTWLGNKLLDKGFDSLHTKVTSKTFNDRFYDKVNKASISLQANHPDALGGNIEYFFKHIDVFNELIKLLFLNSKVDLKVIEEKFDIKTLPDDFILEFINLLREELYRDEYFSDILSNKEIYLISIGINKKIEEVLEISSLSFEEVKKLKGLIESKFQNNFSFLSFFDKYKSSLINNYSQLNFMGLGLDLSIKKGKRKKLEDLFVQPTFSTNESNLEILRKTNPSFSSNNKISLTKIFNFDKNLIILGNPGSGKSIFTKFVSLKLIQSEKFLFDNKKIKDYIPFRIELRKYHAFKKDENEGLIKYLRFLLEIEYGFPNVLFEDIQKILAEKNTLVIFDGLDEIFDLNDKLLIKNDIENFIAQHKNARTIVTSRIIGYDDVALKEEELLKLTINNFDDKQIEEYIKNWYLVEEDDEQIRKKEIDDFLLKRQMIDSELISNPLLLSLIVILYRNNLKVPESKLEIYQSCTKTLVDKWDQSKGMEINISDDIYKRKDTVFADLAYWQYKELSKKDGKVTYQRAKNTVAESLTEKLKIADDFTSDLFSEQFLLYAQKRSLYFDNNFTHKTFLEYFTAFWIFSNIEKKHKKAERDKLIKEYIISPYWHIVLELLINLIDKDQADNEIIDELIKYQLKENEESSTFFLQIFNTIQNVSISTFEEIVKISIYRILDKESKAGKNENYRNPQNSPFFLLSQHFENDLLKQAIKRCITAVLLDKNKFNNDKVLLSFYLELIHESQKFENFNDSDKDDDVYNSFSTETKFEDPLIYVMQEFRFNRLDFNSTPIPFAKEFLENFKKKSFISDLKSKFSNFRYFPIQYICLKNALFNSNKNILNEYFLLNEKYKVRKREIIKNIFGHPFFYEKEEDLEILIKNLNHLRNKDYLILFTPILYKLRFEEIYGRQKEIKPDLKKLINLLEDKKFSKKLDYIIDKNNDETKVKSYIIDNFKLDKSIIKVF
ncbi:hypothetical protein FG167_01195 [Lacinutrix sp. WUR7]|uniref:NACHT domain-containing protein n=1 Tax=Lacinutrix sp. WUR7 TaxID=2653681 RepID=UPI00193D1DFF|nr:hypothetical protein [Lacinutrix sp. WUR7]QRM87893.1 hypothetical protein FG167_01195 [Lacinutrix sp. WUR7]